MQIHPVNRCLVAANQYCSYIPVLSTLSSLVDLFLKCVVHCKPKEAIANNHFYRHITAKNIVDCILLLVPVLGNIIIAIIDTLKRQTAERNFQLAVAFDKGLNVPRNIAKAIHHYMLAANAGHYKAKFNLVLCYQNCKGNSQESFNAVSFLQEPSPKVSSSFAKCHLSKTKGLKNEALALKSFQQDVAQRDEHSKLNLAIFHFHGSGGFPTDKKKALEIAFELVQKGNLRAKVFLGEIYRTENDPQKQAEGLVLIEQAAAAGDVEALFALGNHHLAAKDSAKAIYYWRQAHVKQHPIAPVSLAACLILQSSHAEKEEAYRLFLLAAKNPLTPPLFKQLVLFQLALIYSDGKLVPRNPLEAFRLFSLCADAGDASAIYQLGLCHEKGIGVAKNFTKAFELYEKASKLNYYDATQKMAECYLTGRGTALDIQKGIDLLTQLTNQGNLNALFNSAMCFADGFGFPHDPVHCVELLRLGAEFGHDDSKFQLAVRILHGTGTAVNQSLALTMLSELAKTGHLSSSEMIARCTLYGSGLPVETAKGTDLYNQLMNQGHAYSMYMYALYLFSEPATTSHEKGKKWIQKSFEEGSGEAGLHLANLYQHGSHFPKDLKKALEVLEQSLDKDFRPGHAFIYLSLIRCNMEEIRKALITP